MRNNPWTYAAAACLGVSLSATALATDPQSRFDTLDADQNGLLTQAELQSAPELASQLGSADGNGDGMLDFSEFSQLLASLPR